MYLVGKSEMNIVVTKGLTKRFGDHTAVNRVDLAVPQGLAFGYLGPNGAGKTTLIRMLLGRTSATSGSMRIGGYELPWVKVQALLKVGSSPKRPVVMVT